jgi:phosphopentomutase
MKKIIMRLTPLLLCLWLLAQSVSAARLLVPGGQVIGLKLADHSLTVTAFDARLGQLLDAMDDETILILTADHGCDPAFKGTDHTREYVPLFLCGKPVRGTEEGEAPATYTSFADLAATLAQYFGISYSGAGNSFAEEVFV